MGDLLPRQAQAEVASRELLSSLEVLPLANPIRLLVILALASEGQFPGSRETKVVLARIRSVARRFAMLRSELSDELEDDSSLSKAVEADALLWSRDVDSRRYLNFDGARIATSSAIPSAYANELCDLAAEIAEWRLVQYVAREGRDASADRIVCRVSRSSDSPILFLPSRDASSGIPEGWVDVAVNGSSFQAKFAKIAVNVIHRAGSDENVLGDLLREWYGSEAGMPGTTHRAVFERAAHGYKLSPFVSGEVETLERWSSHLRKDCARLLGVTMGGFESQSGIVVRDGMLLLFVTLDKTGQPDNLKYADKFLDPSTFQWQSQNKTKKDDRTGRLISQGGSEMAVVHLFVRDVGKARGKTQKFVYCGRLTFSEWGEKEAGKPITVVWGLPEAVPETLRTLLRVPKMRG